MITKFIHVLMVYLLLAHLSFGQATDARPVLIAIQVHDVIKSAAWYSNFLGYIPIMERQFPNGVKITVVELNNFRLELVENVKVPSKTEALQKLSIEDVTGFSKVAFRVSDVRALYTELQEKGARFQIEIKESTVNTDEIFFIVLDVDGNWLQFIGAK